MSAAPFVPLAAQVLELGASVAHADDDQIRASLGTPDELDVDDADGLHEYGVLALGVFAARWARNAFPRIVLGHRHAAALMATNAQAAAVGVVAMPWDAFWVAVPSGLVTIEGPLGTHDIVGALVLDGEGAVSIQLADERDVRFSVAAPTMADFGELRHESRGAELVARLVLGAVLELTTHHPAAGRHPSAPPAPVKRDGRGAPTCATYTLRRDVKVDARQAVRDYCAGTTRGAPTVQTLVRGHWKMQPCGAGSAARKYIFVEPYWRGPEDAPIAVRAHRIPDPPTAADAPSPSEARDA